MAQRERTRRGADGGDDADDEHEGVKFSFGRRQGGGGLVGGGRDRGATADADVGRAAVGSVGLAVYLGKAGFLVEDGDEVASTVEDEAAVVGQLKTQTGAVFVPREVS